MVSLPLTIPEVQTPWRERALFLQKTKAPQNTSLLGLQQQGTILALQLVKALDLELHDAEHGVFVFAVDDTTMSVPALFLLRFHHGASLEAHDAQA